MTDDEGTLLPIHNIELIVIDQCGKAFTFEQEVLYPVMTEARFAVATPKTSRRSILASSTKTCVSTANRF